MLRACSLAELRAAGGILAVEVGPRELVIVEADGAVHAVDRACPHEGFGLEEGDVEGRSITCFYHGWRFDLETGTCLTGGEDLRRYEVAVRDGEVLVDATGAAGENELVLAEEGLLGALETGRAGLAARRTARLLGVGAPIERVLQLLARYGATHADAGLDPETAVLADVLELAARLEERQARTLIVADAAAGVAVRLARSTPRFGPEPTTSFAWTDAGVRDTLAALVEDGDAEELEAVVAGMVAWGVEPAEIAAGVIVGLGRGFRGPWPLIVLERAVRLATALGPEVARAALPVAAYGAGAAPDLAGDRRFAAAAQSLAAGGAEPAAAIVESAGAMLQRLDAARDADPRGGASLLSAGLALAYAGAAAWAHGLVGAEASPLLEHARALIAAADTPATEPASAPPATVIEVAAAAAAEPAATGRGLAVCLAAASAAVLHGGPEARAGALRLLATPKRERFTSRQIAGGGLDPA